jgi:methionyl aminopeptidase
MAKRLVQTTFECMWLGIDQVRPGAHLGDIGYAIQKHAEAQGYSVVREYCGHGIGTVFHEDPQILHYGRPGTGLELQAGMIFTIEPMINASLSAQWEHTVLVTETGYDVLTVSAGTPARPPVVAATA